MSQEETPHAAASVEHLKAPATPLAEARLLRAVAWFHFRRGRGATAWPMMQRALGKARTLQRAWLVQGIALELAGMSTASGGFDESESYIRMGRAIWSRAGFPDGDKVTLLQLALLRLEQGRLDEAQQIYRHLRDLGHRAGDRASTSQYASPLGTIAAMKGDFAEAIACFEEHRSHAEALGRHTQVPAALTNLGSGSSGGGGPRPGGILPRGGREPIRSDGSGPPRRVCPHGSGPGLPSAGGARACPDAPGGYVRDVRGRGARTVAVGGPFHRRRGRRPDGNRRNRPSRASRRPPPSAGQLPRSCTRSDAPGPHRPAPERAGSGRPSPRGGATRRFGVRDPSPRHHRHRHCGGQTCTSGSSHNLGGRGENGG